MASETLLYFPVDVHSNSLTTRYYAPMRPNPVTEDSGQTVYVLTATVGSLHQGLYVMNGPCFQFVLPQPLLSEVLISGGSVDVYMGLPSPITVSTDSIVYKNGIAFDGFVLDGPALFCVIVPPNIPIPPPPSADPLVVAARNISGHRVIKATATGADYASSAEPLDAYKVLGISKGAVLAGQEVEVQTVGPMTEPSWNWDLDKPVFNGVDGLLTQVSAVPGYSLIVGVPISPTTILVAVKQPIITL